MRVLCSILASSHAEHIRRFGRYRGHRRCVILADDRSHRVVITSAHSRPKQWKQAHRIRDLITDGIRARRDGSALLNDVHGITEMIRVLAELRNAAAALVSSATDSDGTTVVVDAQALASVAGHIAAADAVVGVAYEKTQPGARE